MFKSPRRYRWKPLLSLTNLFRLFLLRCFVVLQRVASNRREYQTLTSALGGSVRHGCDKSSCKILQARRLVPFDSCDEVCIRVRLGLTRGLRVMSLSGLAAARMEDLMRPKSPGQMVNPHVVAATTTPAPNLQGLRELLNGRDSLNADRASATPGMNAE